MLTVDRIENGFAVIETDDGHIEVSSSSLADGVKEGDAVFLENGVYRKDVEATEKRKQEIIKLQNSLWE